MLSLNWLSWSPLPPAEAPCFPLRGLLSLLCGLFCGIILLWWIPRPPFFDEQLPDSWQGAVFALRMRNKAGQFSDGRTLTETGGGG